MTGLRAFIRRRVAVAILAAASASAGAMAPAPRTIATIDLMRPFATRTPWRFTARQGPDVPDEIGSTDPADLVPGRISLCLSRSGGPCLPSLAHHPLAIPGDNVGFFDDPHFLEVSAIVRPRAGQPLLLLRFASVHSGDNDQRVGTALLGYDRAHDRFELAYRRLVGRNRNDEVRYIDSGPLAGAVISAEPTGDAPFGYWIIVNRLSAGSTYRPVLRYRSATHYQDGNPLAVIDSEMPNIERRLGLWHSGEPLPLPTGGCAQPHLVGMELWCGPPVSYR